jgi:hypothetical protein
MNSFIIYPLHVNNSSSQYETNFLRCHKWTKKKFEKRVRMAKKMTHNKNNLKPLKQVMAHKLPYQMWSLFLAKMTASNQFLQELNKMKQRNQIFKVNISKYPLKRKLYACFLQRTCMNEFQIKGTHLLESGCTGHQKLTCDFKVL